MKPTLFRTIRTMSVPELDGAYALLDALTHEEGDLGTQPAFARAYSFILEVFDCVEVERQVRSESGQAEPQTAMSSPRAGTESPPASNLVEKHEARVMSQVGESAAADAQTRPLGPESQQTPASTVDDFMDGTALCTPPQTPTQTLDKLPDTTGPKPAPLADQEMDIAGGHGQVPTRGDVTYTCAGCSSEVAFFKKYPSSPVPKYCEPCRAARLGSNLPKPEARKKIEALAVPPRTCRTCGKEFQPKGFRTASKSCDDCLDGKAAEPPKVPIDGPVSTKCEDCGKEFEQQALPRGGRRRQYCDSCRDARETTNKAAARADTLKAEPLPSGHPTTEQLVDLVRQGDREAFEKLHDRYAKSIESGVTSFAGKVDTEAVLQDIWAMCFETRLEAFRGGSFLAWLRTVARNRCIDEGRRARTEPLPDDAILPEKSDADPETIVIARDEAERAVALLPERDRDLVVAKAEGFSAKEIGEATGLSPGNVNVRVHRAVRRVRAAADAAQESQATAAEPEALPEVADNGDADPAGIPTEDLEGPAKEPELEDLEQIEEDSDNDPPAAMPGAKPSIGLQVAPKAPKPASSTFDPNWVDKLRTSPQPAHNQGLTSVSMVDVPTRGQCQSCGQVQPIRTGGDGKLCCTVCASRWVTPIVGEGVDEFGRKVTRLAPAGWAGDEAQIKSGGG